MEIDLKGLQKQINEIANENEKLKRTKEKYIEIAKKIREKGEELINIAKEIDPITTTDTTRRNTGKKEKIEEIYRLIEAGTQITKEKLSIMYPELTEDDLNNYLQTLKKLPKIEVAKDKGRIRLFHREN